MANFVYKYGGYTHETGEVVDFSWEAFPHFTKRGWRDLTTVRATIKGQILGCDYAEVFNKVKQFHYAYGENGKLFQVVKPDGTIWHQMDPSDPLLLVGPRVSVLRYPEGSLEEMVVKREYIVQIECIRDEAESQIIEYYESVRHIGTTFGTWASQWTMNTVPVWYPTSIASTMTIIQEGHSIGLNGYYLAGASPLLGPSYEHQEKAVMEPGKPLHLGKYFVYYPWKWRFEFETAVPMLLLPR